jgi:hypothetical protein
MIVAHDPMALSASAVRKLAMRTENGDCSVIGPTLPTMCDWVI